uniref:CobW C-terminal domain-containing protein n=1 Tax=Timspurckia oligopyrenoides TaxID=708627 RepID=A0A7S0ZDR1_9RHOD|mmetsp:Transcript_13681/g.24528  ORF Transcript_13681/g.24528 Transcript_13681/m.24528 type:complete len:419 (+) Transcript_13681:19-1275(+)
MEDVEDKEYVDCENFRFDEDGEYESEARKRMWVSFNASVANEILREMPSRGVAVTLLTGFLGAGKTTLLNYILKQPHEMKIAVLVNEFGSIDIDSQLIETGNFENEDAILLKNGCICCTISNSFVESVYKVLQKTETPPDYIMIETSGIADPAPIIATLQETELDDEVYIDQILTVVDAAHYLTSSEYTSVAAVNQIKLADTLLISKTDLVDDSILEKTIESLLRVQPRARILKSNYGRVSIGALFDIKIALDTTLCRTGSDKRTRYAECSAGEHGDCTLGETCRKRKVSSSLSRTQVESNHLDTDGFESISFYIEKPFDLNKFRKKFVNKMPDGVYRSKGLLWFAGHALRFVFQLSGKRFQIEQVDWPSPEVTKKSNQLVVIGRNLDSESITHTLNSCVIADPNYLDKSLTHKIIRD